MGRDIEPGIDAVAARPGDPASRLSTHVRPGQVLLGKYRIGEVIGSGGMGLVVAAHHLQLDQRVAIKFVQPEIASNQAAVTRFLREARAAIKIKSEHVVRISDVGTLDDGTAFLVMEYLDGRDLASWLTAEGPLDVPLAVELVLQACEAIAEAHALEIVHRDLKPANLFAIRRADGLLAIRVLDFGISKSTGAAGSTSGLGLTRTGEMIGSPLYMSPEQLLKPHEADRRADVWSLGVVLYELLSGHRPFDGESVPVVCAKILQGTPPPLRLLRPEIPPGLEAAISRCLEKNPSARFDDVGELAAAIVEFGPPRARFSAERIERTVVAGGAARRPRPSEAGSPRVGTQMLPPVRTMVLDPPAPVTPPKVTPPRAVKGARQPASGRAARFGIGFAVIAVGAASAWVAAQLLSRPKPADEHAAVAPAPSPSSPPPAPVPSAPPPPAEPPPAIASHPSIEPAPEPPPAPPRPVIAAPAPTKPAGPAKTPQVSKKAAPAHASAHHQVDSAPVKPVERSGSILDLVDDRR
jgi:serine/threonine-protein kinase